MNGLETTGGKGVRAQHIVCWYLVPVAARCHTVVSGARWAVAPPLLTNFGGKSDPLCRKIGGGASDPRAEFLGEGCCGPPGVWILGNV